MKILRYDAATNSKCLQVRFTGYGHFNISMWYRGHVIGTVTTNTQAVDDLDYDSSVGSKSFYRHHRAYEALVNEIIRSNAGV